MYKLKKNWERLLSWLVIFIILLVGAAALYARANRGRIYHGVQIGSFPVGGLTPAAAEKVVQAAVGTLRQSGLVFSYRDRNLPVPMTVSAAADLDLTYEVITYDVPATVARAYAYGRTGGGLWRWLERLRALATGAVLMPAYDWRQDKVLEILHAGFAAWDQPAQNARLVVKDGEISLAQESAGLTFDWRTALSAAAGQLNGLVFAPISLHLQNQAPSLTAALAQSALPAARAFMAGGDITISWAGQEWVLSRALAAEFLEVRPLPVRPGAAAGAVELGFSLPEFSAWLAPLSAAITIMPQEPKFKLANGRVAEFKPSVAGREFNLEATLRAWEQAIIVDKKTAVEPVIIISEPTQKIGNLNDLGIKELLGVGKSNFKGSPRNRRHNIAVGAAAVNGTLIAPSAEFSLLKTLGKIDASTGYLPELVIKGNKTVPEYGGGLCQIGTTTFRATLAAGLPVVERQNHSYAVTYYNNDKGLPGTDATIYNPKPDYRFKNDTGNYVLITTRIEGDDLFFEVWGTKDGRQAEQSAVRVWDRVSPPPVKLVETLDLAPGEKKCTEKPHAGIKAAFDYKITYPDGRVDAQTFSSQYRPWQEVCLIGVAELTPEAPPEN